MAKFLDSLFGSRYSHLDAVAMVLFFPIYSWIGLWAFAVMIGSIAVSTLVQRAAK